ncbi:hypothetical protein FYM84_04260 [Pseudomonas sp. CAH-1]|nr:hypothetical protein [Pseudomonas sp. CAH-1]PPB14773.1 hypothetical protein HV87_08595 [Pseudomonas aeruginosa]QEQ86154.1 hypothetical protein F1602_02000 [Pseudomonas putida]
MRHLKGGADPCRSGLVSRKGPEAAPAFSALMNCWGRFAALSRHKAAPTGGPVPSLDRRCDQKSLHRRKAS